MKRALASLLLSLAVAAQPAVPCLQCLATAADDGTLYTTGPVGGLEGSPVNCTEGSPTGMYVARYRLYTAQPDWVACFDAPVVSAPRAVALTKAGALLIGAQGAGSPPQPWLIEFDLSTRKMTTAVSLASGASEYMIDVVERDDGAVVVANSYSLVLISAPPRTVVWTRPRKEALLQLAPASAGRFFVIGGDSVLSLLEPDGEREVWHQSLPFSARGYKLLADRQGGVWAAGASSDITASVTPGAWQPQHAGSPLYRCEFGTWFEHLTGLESITEVTAIVPSPANRVTYFAAASDGVYRTENNGWTWVKRSSGLPAGRVSALLLRPAGLLAASGASLYSSADAGLTWTAVNDALPFTFPSAGGLAAAGDTLYAAAGDAWRSDDSGVTWRKILAAGEGASGFTRISAGPGGRVVTVRSTSLGGGFGPGIVIAVIQASADGGATWSETRLTGVNIKEIRFDPLQDGVVWAASGSGLLRSVDGGRVWETIGAARSLTSLAFPQDDPKAVFVSGFDGSVWRIDKDSLAWTPWTPAITSLSIGGLAIGEGGVALLGASIQADALIRHYSPAGDLLYSTWFGGAGAESVGGLALDASGDVAVAGDTVIPDWEGNGTFVASRSVPYILWLRPTGPLAAVYLRDPGSGLGLHYLAPFGWWLNDQSWFVPVWLMP